MFIHCTQLPTIIFWWMYQTIFWMSRIFFHCLAIKMSVGYKVCFYKHLRHIKPHILDGECRALCQLTSYSGQCLADGHNLGSPQIFKALSRMLHRSAHSTARCSIPWPWLEWFRSAQLNRMLKEKLISLGWAKPRRIKPAILGPSSLQSPLHIY